MTVRIAAKGLRASRGRTLLLLAALTIASTMLSGAIIAGIAAARESTRVDAVNATHAVIAEQSTNQPHTRWHVDHVVLGDHGSMSVIDVAGSAPGAPVPTALRSIPAPGTVLLSPALQRLVDRGEFTPPGRVVGTLPHPYVKSGGDLVMMIGWRYDQLVGFVRDTHQITSFEGGHGLHENAPPWFVLIAIVFLAPFAILLGLPLCAFVAASARVGAQRRAERLRALRLVGMTAGQVRRAAAFEAATVGFAAAIAGSVIATVIVSAFSFATSDVFLGFALALAFTMMVVPMISGIVAFIGLARVEISPLGVHSPRRLRGMNIAMFAILWGSAMYILTFVVQTHTGGPPAAYLVLATAFFAAMARRPVTRRIGAVMTRRARRLPALVSGRRLQRDPQIAARGLGVLALAFFLVSFAIVNYSTRPASAATTNAPRTSTPDFRVTTQEDNFGLSLDPSKGIVIDQAASGSADIDAAGRDLAPILRTRVVRVLDLYAGDGSLHVAVGSLCALPGAPKDCRAPATDVVASNNACSPRFHSGGCHNPAPARMSVFNSPVTLTASTGDSKVSGLLKALGVDGAISETAAAKVRGHASTLLVWSSRDAQRQVAETIVRHPGLSLQRSTRSTNVARALESSILFLLFIVIPIASSVAIGAGDRSYARRRSLAASWAIGVPRRTLRRAALIEVSIPLTYVTVTSCAAGVALGWITHGGAPETYATWAAIGLVVAIGLTVWLAATAAIAPIISRSSAERALRTT